MVLRRRRRRQQPQRPTAADARRFATKRDAERALRDLLRSVDHQRYVERSKLTLGDYLLKEWLPAMAPPRLRETSWASYGNELRLNVLPMLGEVPLQALRPADLNSCTRTCCRRGA